MLWRAQTPMIIEELSQYNMQQVTDSVICVWRYRTRALHKRSSTCVHKTTSVGANWRHYCSMGYVKRVGILPPMHRFRLNAETIVLNPERLDTEKRLFPD